MSQEIKPFVPVWLDGARLKPQPFRILCNLYARRNAKTNQCNPSVARIATDCYIHRDTVWKWLEWLERERWIVRTSGGGKESNQYTLFHFGASKPDGGTWPAPDGVPTDPCARPPSGNGGLAPSGKSMLAPSGKQGPRMYNKECKQRNINKYSPNPSEQRSNDQFPKMGKPEIEAILEGLGFSDSVYGFVYARMESLGWRTPEGSSFRSPVSTARFLEGLADRMEVR